MIATQYSTASEASGCRHSTTVLRVLGIIELPASARFARGTALGGDTNRIIHALSARWRNKNCHLLFRSELLNSNRPDYVSWTELIIESVSCKFHFAIAVDLHCGPSVITVGIRVDGNI